VALHDTNAIIKFADSITVVGMITNIDESAYREEEIETGIVVS
jgi:hypothetical protein